MGIIRSLFFFLLCYYFLKFFYRFLKLSQKKPESKKAKPFHPQSSQAMIMEEMKKCPSCGTFNPKSIAVVKNEGYYCNQTCLKS